MNIPELEGMDPSMPPSTPPETPDLPEIGESTSHQDILDSIWTVADGGVDWVEDGVDGADEKQRKRAVLNVTIRKKYRLGVTSKKRQERTKYTISENGLQCYHGKPKRICLYCVDRKP